MSNSENRASREHSAEQFRHPKRGDTAFEVDGNYLKHEALLSLLSFISPIAAIASSIARQLRI